MPCAELLNATAAPHASIHGRSTVGPLAIPVRTDPHQKRCCVPSCRPWRAGRAWIARRPNRHARARWKSRGRSVAQKTPVPTHRADGRMKLILRGPGTVLPSVPSRTLRRSCSTSPGSANILHRRNKRAIAAVQACASLVRRRGLLPVHSCLPEYLRRASVEWLLVRERIRLRGHPAESAATTARLDFPSYAVSAGWDVRGYLPQAPAYRNF
jgi:hypothetical protein